MTLWTSYSSNVVAKSSKEKVPSCKGSDGIYLAEFERDSYLEYPGPLASEGVASVDNVPVLGEACQHVLDTLLECVDLATGNNN